MDARNRGSKGESATPNERRAAADLLPQLYAELKALAEQRMRREGPGQTLQATALVHEAYMRLVGEQDPGWDGRAHFFGAAAEAMRRILVERARGKARLKRGGERKRTELGEVATLADEPDLALLDLDRASSPQRMRAKHAWSSCATSPG